MARDDFTATFAPEDDGVQLHGKAGARKRFERMIVPFTMPLLIGPGAISTVIIYASEAKAYGLAGTLIGLSVFVAVSISTMLAFWASPLISKLLGKIGLTVIVRILGLILCAMAVQFILAGIADSTHGLISKSASAPYQSKN